MDKDTRVNYSSDVSERRAMVQEPGVVLVGRPEWLMMQCAELHTSTPSGNRLQASTRDDERSWADLWMAYFLVIDTHRRPKIFYNEHMINRIKTHGVGSSSWACSMLSRHSSSLQIKQKTS